MLYIIVYPNDLQYKGMDAYFRRSYAKNRRTGNVKLVSEPKDATVFRTKKEAQEVFGYLKFLKPITGHLKPYIAKCSVDVQIDCVKVS
jgi:hypothetical protein